MVQYPHSSNCCSQTVGCADAFQRREHGSTQRGGKKWCNFDLCAGECHCVLHQMQRCFMARAAALRCWATSKRVPNIHRFVHLQQRTLKMQALAFVSYVPHTYEIVYQEMLTWCVRCALGLYVRGLCLYLKCRISTSSTFFCFWTLAMLEWKPGTLENDLFL